MTIAPDLAYRAESVGVADGRRHAQAAPAADDASATLDEIIVTTA